MRISEYRLADRADALLTALERAAGEDLTAERRRRIAGWIAALFGAAIFFSLFLIAIHWAFGLLTLLSVALFAAALTAYFLVKRHDLDDRKLGTALRVLKVLRADIAQAEKVSLRLDFRGYQAGGQLLSKEGLTGGQKNLRYSHAWMELRTRLADGTFVRLAITDHVRRKEKPKRKYTKVNERTVCQASVVARLAKRYGDAAAIEARLKAAPPLPGLQLHALSAQNRAVRATFATPAAVSQSGRNSYQQGLDKMANGDTLLAALRYIYSGLSPARKAA
ncbi:MAG: hypothetical protein MUF51_02075 [Vicinamibacteria bacterium]|jgi:hypothetical protein|nr:hypothetical protein [Vicinamibacteria bacterium]